MNETHKKWIWVGARFLICAVALAWVLNNITYHDYVTLSDGDRLRIVDETDTTITVVRLDGEHRTVQRGQIALGEDGAAAIERGLRTTWQRANKSVLLWSLLVFAPATFFQSLRFRWLLHAQDVKVTCWESIKLCYAGNFLNFVTVLGSTGGDVFKMYYVSLHTDRKIEAATTVVLDRIVGLFGLVMLASIVIIARMGDSKLSSLGLGVGVVLMGGALAAFVLFSDRLHQFIGAPALLAKLPFAEPIRRMVAATRRLAAHKRLVGAALVSTLVLQLVALTSYMMAASALGMDTKGGKVWDYYAYFAGGSVVSAIPISFQGLGTTEAYYKHVFLGTHGTLAAILCLAMAVRAINLLWSLPGLVVTLTGSYKPRISEKDVPSPDGPVPPTGRSSCSVLDRTRLSR